MSRLNEEISKQNYDKLLSSGMFWEIYPGLSGEWEKDRDIYITEETILDEHFRNREASEISLPEAVSTFASPLNLPAILQLFTPDRTEILRFENDGNIYLHGKLIAEDIEVVQGFREFLQSQGFL